MYVSTTRVNTEVVLDIGTGKVLSKKFHRYWGKWELACGGPTSQQTAAATSTANIDSTLAGMFQTDATQTQPFYENLLANGLPYFNAQSQYSTSALAQGEGQAEAAQSRSLAGEGSTLPSGFATAAKTDLQGKTA
jgi:hypothetical protein